MQPEFTAATVQARTKGRAVNAASVMAGQDDNSDEEVYATAENMDKAMQHDAEERVLDRCA